MARKEPNRAAILTGELCRYIVSGKSVYSIASTVQELQDIATRLQQIAVNMCNGYQTWDHKHDAKREERDEKLQERLRQKFNDLLAGELPGVTATFGGDPRGNVVKLQIPGTEGDGWGRDGWGVYK